MVGQGAGQLGHVVAGLGGLGHADEGRPGSRSARASARAARTTSSSSTAPPAATWSSSRQGVAGRPPAPADGGVDGVVAQLQAGLVADPAQEVDQGVGPEEPELEVLGPAADGGQHLLGLGGGQDEDDMTGGLLQGFEQGVGGGRGQHVDLVDDVDLPPARRPQGGVGDELPHGVDTVVGGGVQLVDVERRAPGRSRYRNRTRHRAHPRRARRS